MILHGVGYKPALLIQDLTYGKSLNVPPVLSGLSVMRHLPDVKGKE